MFTVPVLYFTWKAGSYKWNKNKKIKN